MQKNSRINIYIKITQKGMLVKNEKNAACLFGVCFIDFVTFTDCL